jgi:uncharacterized protein
MQTNILWTGREYYSLENCLITTTDEGAVINSTIIGRYGEIIYRVEYTIRTNKNWETLFCEINSRHSNLIQHLQFESGGKGSWTANGKPANEFKGCTDVDIPLTPFTNTLPINRLKLAHHQKQQIKVVYIDLLQQQTTPVHQQYIRLSDSEYHYENMPNDFEANIQVDQWGFVVDYPSLFVRTASLETNYY